MVLYSDEAGGDNNVLLILQSVTGLNNYDFIENVEDGATIVATALAINGPTVTDIL